MDIRQLRVFAAVAEQQNFTRAAETLHIAQPAVSIAIRKLEEELELTLLNRQEKKVTLTAEGQSLLDHARRILDNLRVAEEDMAELKGLGRGEVKIGIPPMMSAHFFPRIIMEFRKHYPDLKVVVSGEGSASIHNMISQGEIDIGVIADHKIASGVGHQHFLREEIVICVPREHPFAALEKVTLADFFSQPLILYTPGYYMRELMDGLVKKTGHKTDVVFETNLFSLVRSMIKEGMGISTFLKMVVSDDPDLAAVSFHPPLFLDLDIAWKKNRHLSKANRAFIDFLIEYTQQ
ncbi:LysR family transcriptional regulator [Desulfogranum japonicum]|uniref:LysR family transcriptional regulator n=1 Tax=Desulfogranum japonicum TaxID=231447 RepID=UPI00048BD3EA|nr:LysR family transcriptional regulator [Desulfogranum japonicum]